MSESEKYPGDLDYAKWADEFHELTGFWASESLAYHDFLARKACDWQRARDAEICLEISKEAPGEVTIQDWVAEYCAKRIRESS